MFEERILCHDARKSVRKLLMLTALFMTLQTPVSASLYHQTDSSLTSFTPRLTTDPQYVQFYISSTSNFSSHASYVRTGVTAWNSSTHSIDLTETNTYRNSICDVKGYNGNSSAYAEQKDLLGFAVVYCGDGAYGNNNTPYYDSAEIPSNYWGGEAFINLVEIPASDLGNASTQKMLKTVAAHEIGHILGLGHVSSDQFIMRDGYVYSQPTSPPNSEKRAVRNLYNAVFD